ncbi:MAG: ABC transporter substrate-binding protein [Candidatus Competibacterales bacterium]|nr:ABC transporter substrate-binding protein [Candidatus Competibacterales bacterium]
MSVKRLLTTGLTTAALLGTLGTPPVVQAQDGQYLPLLVYRSGPFAPNGIPVADGWVDYIKLINARDGGINGVKLVWEECDTGYNNDRGVECYERLKRPGAATVQPLSTGITYALIPRASADKIPLFTSGYGRTSASYGPVFPYVFTAPITYWGGADVMIQYIAGEEGGYDQLAGKKIALVYHDSAYGKEPISTLEKLAAEHGFELSLFPVPHPGLEQKATWLQIGRQIRPDWTLMWGWGVMNSTAIKEAAAVGYPLDRFIGIWWSGSEQDVKPAGAAATGYKALNYSGAGTDFPVIQDIIEHVYDAGNGTAESRDEIGTVLYNRGVLLMAMEVEAIRAAQAIHGEKPLTGEQIQDGWESLELTPENLEALGMKDFTKPVKITCEDHEGGGQAFVQQWDGNQWNQISDWYTPNREMLKPMYREDAMAYAQENGITPRDCG